MVAQNFLLGSKVYTIKLLKPNNQFKVRIQDINKENQSSLATRLIKQRLRSILYQNWNWIPIGNVYDSIQATRFLKNMIKVPTFTDKINSLKLVRRKKM